MPLDLLDQERAEAEAIVSGLERGLVAREGAGDLLALDDDVPALVRQELRQVGLIGRHLAFQCHGPPLSQLPRSGPLFPLISSRNPLWPTRTREGRRRVEVPGAGPVATQPRSQ